MYKTNAKRKSHIIKNHPDCELPEKPTDKVRDCESIILMPVGVLRRGGNRGSGCPPLGHAL
jgi:hypothetical protein